MATYVRGRKPKTLEEANSLADDFVLNWWWTYEVTTETNRSTNQEKQHRKDNRIWQFCLSVLHDNFCNAVFKNESTSLSIAAWLASLQISWIHITCAYFSVLFKWSLEDEPELLLHSLLDALLPVSLTSNCPWLCINYHHKYYSKLSLSNQCLSQTLFTFYMHCTLAGFQS